MSLPLSAGLVADAGLPVTPVLSPDGRRIGYGRQPGGTLHVVTVGGPTRTVGEGRTPRWSADSRHLFFLAGGELWRERADGGDRTSWPVAARDFVPLADLATVVVLSPDPGEPDPWVWSEAAGHDRLRLLGVFEAAHGGSIGWEGAGPHPHDERSPISYAARITTPVLIVHGAEDANVPLGQAVFLHRALRRFGVEHEFVVYPREGHTIAERAHRLDLLRRTREWFRRLNPGRS
ncbi:S9 family peptidase [Nonomuraea sp. NPDC050328]|uniref:S9 family peptidase n=1 Tax=Nonomuraea sp. NPDC050328 TaxID=3364361 RepID=UPI0037986EA6